MSKKLDSILEKLQKTYDVKIDNPKEAGKLEKMPLDSPGLNFVLGGGWVHGRIYLFSGPQGQGKSTLASYIASQIQKHYKERPVVAYFDTEYSIDASHLEEMGVDLDKNFLLIRPNNGEDAFEMMKELINSDEIGLIILDSLTALGSKAQNEDFFKATFGGQAAMYSSALRGISPYLFNHKCSLIMVSQERQNLSMWGSDTKITGGFAPAYYASWMARVTRTEDIVDKNKGIIGLMLKVKNSKSRFTNPKRETILKLMFHGGISSDDEYLDFLDKLGLIERKGAWFYNEEWGMKVSGKNGVADFLHNNPELYEKVKKQVNDMICGHTILDNENEDDSEEDEEDINFNPETGEITE